MQVVGVLLHKSTATKPDISVAVKKLNRRNGKDQKFVLREKNMGGS